MVKPPKKPQKLSCKNIFLPEIQQYGVTSTFL